MMNKFISFFVFWSFLLTGSVADDEESFVSCGSAIKIQHKDTNYYLNSEEKSLGTGSGQQLVTFVKDPATHNTLWIVRPANHKQSRTREFPPSASCQLAEPVKCGATVRLVHSSTKRNLHSHGVQSPLSRQQEITAYGTGDGLGDNGDNWKVMCLNAGAEFWQVSNEDDGDYYVRLQHVDTGKYLGASKNLEFNAQTCGGGCPIMNHLEAFGRAGADNNSIFKVEQGVFLAMD